MTRLRNEAGQTAVLTVLFLVGLLGAAAMVLDVGSWFREQRATQSAADAAALAAAQALPESPGDAGVLALQYIAENGGGAHEITYSSSRMANDTISVKVTREAPGIFAKLFGIDSVEVHGEASARAGTPDQARYAAPIAVDRKHPLLNCKPLPCFKTNTTLELETVGPGAFRLLNVDGTKGGTGGKIDANWILRGYDGLMPLGWYGSDPGAAFNDQKFREALTIRLGDELLFPVYDKVMKSGANFEYNVIGWVGFVVTKYGPDKGNNWLVEGYFVRVIWDGIQGDSGGADDLGVRSVELVE